MSRDRVNGTLLVVGGLIGIAVALSHPTGHAMVAGPDAESVRRLGVIVHGVALTSVPILFLGLWGLSRALGWSDVTRAALVAYGFGGTATLGAAVASGFVATPIMEQLQAGQNAELYHLFGWYTYLFNQGFARVGAYAAATAIALWSAAMVREAGAVRLLGALGILVGAGVLIGLVSGYLGLDVHGFAVMTIAKSLWLILVGAMMWRVGTNTALS